VDDKLGRIVDRGEIAALALMVVDVELAGLFEMMTAPERQRRGLAKWLVADLLRWSRERGARTGWLAVVADNQPRTQAVEINPGELHGGPLTARLNRPVHGHVAGAETGRCAADIHEGGSNQTALLDDKRPVSQRSEVPRADQTRGACSDDDDVALDELVELLVIFSRDVSRDITLPQRRWFGLVHIASQC